MSRCVISLAQACHYERFTVESSAREYLFQWKCVRFQRTAECSWSERAPDCHSLLVCSRLLADQYSPAHFDIGLGGDRVLHFILFSTLYVALSQYVRLSGLSECEWVSGCERIRICDITDCCFIFRCDVFSPLPLERAAEVFHYLQIFDWCIKQIITQPPVSLQIFKF